MREERRLADQARLAAKAVAMLGSQLEPRVPQDGGPTGPTGKPWPPSPRRRGYLTAAPTRWKNSTTPPLSKAMMARRTMVHTRSS